MGLTGVLLVLAAIVALTPPLWAPPLAAAVAAGVIAAADRAVLKSALRLSAVLGLLFAAAVGGTVVAWRLGPERGLMTGGILLCRLIVLWLLTGYLARRVDADALVVGARRLRLEPLALVFGLALNALPRLLAAVEEVWIAFRMRHQRRRSAWRHASAMAEVLLAHTARLGHDAAAAAALRGHAAFLRPGASRMPTSTPAVVVTGRPGSGKTPVVARAVELLRERSVKVAGILQPAEQRDGDKVGFRILDLGSGAEASLASRVERGEGALGTRFIFAPEGLALARQAIANAPAGSVLVVDELGPLELRGEGHMPALETTLRQKPPAALVLVVRRHLIPALVARLASSEATIVDVDSDEDASEKVVSSIERALGTFRHGQQETPQQEDP